MRETTLARATELLEKAGSEMGVTEGDRVLGWTTLAVAEQTGRIASGLEELNSSLHNLGVAVSGLKSKDAF